MFETIINYIDGTKESSKLNINVSGEVTTATLAVKELDYKKIASGGFLQARKQTAGQSEPAAAIFFHPDCTVGTGITPVQLSLADFTAGRELHPALKTCYFSLCVLYFRYDAL